MSSASPKSPQSLEKGTQVTEYLQKVASYLPVAAAIRTRLVQQIQGDVVAALHAAEGTDQSIEDIFGAPINVARDIAKSQDWITRPASFGLRFLAWVIDLLLIGFTGGFLLSNLFETIGNKSLPDAFADPIYLLILFTGVTFLIVILITYFAGCEYKYGATIGKKVLGLIVCDESGIKINGSQAILRNIPKFQGLLLLIDILLCKLSPQKGYLRSLDALARTLVVKAPKSR